MMNMMGSNTWMMGGMWLLSGLFWILIVAGAVLIVRWLAARNGRGKESAAEPPAPTPLVILKTRYASGEIDRETYEAMKRDIVAGDDES